MPTGLDFGHIRGSATLDLGGRKRSLTAGAGRGRLPPSPGLVPPGSRSSSCSHSSRPAERARLLGARPFQSAPGAPRLSISELVLHQPLVDAVCGSGRWSAGDAGAARAARADRPSSAVPVSSRLFGPVAKSAQSPSYPPRRPRRAPEARGGPRSPKEPAGWTARQTAATASRWGEGPGAARAGLGREAGRGACEWARRPLGATGESEASSCGGRGLMMAGSAEGWPFWREAGMLLQRAGGVGSSAPAVIVERPDYPSPDSRPPQPEPWVTAMTSMIEGAGTSLDESAAITTVPGREMKDVEGMIGMTGRTQFFLNFGSLFYCRAFKFHCSFLKALFIRSSHMKSLVFDCFMWFDFIALWLNF